MSLSLKPAHAAVKAYYDTLHQFGQLSIDHEGAVRSAFQTLLAACGRKATPKLTLVPEYRIERARSSVIVDGAMVDMYHLPYGYWEAKDEQDDLAKEVSRKLDKGYPRDNIIFQAPERAILYQGNAKIFDDSIVKPEALVYVVNTFFDYKAPHIVEWEEAVGDFSERIPELSGAVEKLIDEERRRNPAFVRSFDDFYALCRQAINPNLSQEAVERMLVQHLLTERIFRKIFNNPDFTRRNVVAAEIEKVITELTRRAFNRDEFLSGLDRFYKAIERSAEETSSFSEKQAFLNKVYERFFQGYSPKEADTHGIVYTPQPIVNFMVRSVEEILQKEFGRSLGDKGVHILDPFVGTGNFIVRIMQEIPATDLPYKYENELHCNELMLLPYYIASMNIEHAFFDRTGEYKAFPGICLVDTFELAEADQSKFSFMTAENADRVRRQKESPIFVIIGNPPYNAWQADENDNNRNRKYPTTDKRIADTYGRDSTAQNKNALADPYIKAIRWASDRIGPEGVLSFVTNSGFTHSVAADGMRKHLARDFSEIYILDLGGNVRRNPKLSGTTHNVFGIQVGVSINILIRRKTNQPCTVHYAKLADPLRKEQKYKVLDDAGKYAAMKWTQIPLQDDQSWLPNETNDGFQAFLSIGNPETKSGSETSAIFGLYSRGVETTRDEWVYNFDAIELRKNVERLAENYNAELNRWQDSDRTKNPTADGFVSNDPQRIKWSSSLKQALLSGQKAVVQKENFRSCLYRPFCKEYVYFDRLLTHRRGKFPVIVPSAESANTLIGLPGPGSERPFHTLTADGLADLHLSGAGCSTECFPFYNYDDGAATRRENITDWALEQFRSHYADKSITKWDIFHYVYAVLHHPEYRERYAANLRRELPRIPFVSGKAGTKDTDVFRAFVKTGKRLAEIHVHYEKQPEYKLAKIEKSGKKLDYCVTKMRLSKDKTQIAYNDFLTLSGIPPETFEYRLGNRSALDWVIDQYQVSTDKRSGITNDPNRADDPQYILRLVGQVITVSLETVKLVNSLPPFLPSPPPS
ncbi:MAG: type ISP restriction/modification enzyme [Candidatus Acidiferrales bacterium]